MISSLSWSIDQIDMPSLKFDGSVDKPVDKLVDILSETELKVFSAIKEHPKMAQPEIAALVGVGKTTVQNVIVKFKKMGILTRRGSNKTGYWETSGVD